MDKRLLTILRCPVSHKGLSVLKKDKLQRLNTAINAGELVNQDGARLAGHLSEALITDDGKRVYPVADGIPVLLEGEGISMEQLA
ncbi:MAG: Trm112 family protein [Gammaproteobacteria bacterium]|nr:Trm112 family protein [Gammaproteobacteria bacterium]